MHHPTSSTEPATPSGHLRIDRAHQHRLVEVVHTVDENVGRPQPIRDPRLHQPSFLESTTRLVTGAGYERRTP
jgi:hypothetical protein